MRRRGGVKSLERVYTLSLRRKGEPARLLSTEDEGKTYILFFDRPARAEAFMWEGVDDGQGVELLRSGIREEVSYETPQIREKCEDTEVDGAIVYWGLDVLRFDTAEEIQEFIDGGEWKISNEKWLKEMTGDE